MSSSTLSSSFEHVPDLEAGMELGPTIPNGSVKIAAIGIVKPSDHTNIVTWEPGDAANPYNWTRAKRSTAILFFCLKACIVAMAATIVAPAQENIMKEFKVNEEVAILGVSIMVLGWATGPLVFSPSSELWGRNMVYAPTWVLFVIFNIGSAVSTDIGAFLACRLIAGIAASPITAMAPATAYDMFTVSEVGPYILLLACFALMGSTLGNALGGYIVQYAGWRWTLWYTVILSGILLFGYIWIPETHANTLLGRKAANLRRETGLNDWRTQFDQHQVKKVVIFRTAIWRPWQLLLLEPIVLLSSLAIGFVWGVLYLYLGAYQLVFSEVYGFGIGDSGAAFLAITLGVVATIPAAPFFNRAYQKLVSKHGKGATYPEARLPMAMIATTLIPISIFWFAWSCDKSVHWIVPIISGIPYGFGQSLLFMSFMAYITDCFPHLSASAGAASTLIRLLFAMSFPLMTPSLYRHLDHQWAASMLGFIGLCFIPLPIIFYKYGPYLRQKSRFRPQYV